MHCQRNRPGDPKLSKYSYYLFQTSSKKQVISSKTKVKVMKMKNSSNLISGTWYTRTI